MNDKELEDVVLHVACIFMGFEPSKYWKSAIRKQHLSALEESTRIVVEFSNEKVEEAIRLIHGRHGLDCEKCYFDLDINNKTEGEHEDE